MTMDSRVIKISTVRSYKDTDPEPATITWGEFVDSCRYPIVRGALPLDRYLAADKDTRDRQKDGCAIIAGSFSRSGTRHQDYLESLAMVTLDFDDSPYTFDELCEKLECFEAVVFTSYSHSGQAPKYRAYLPLSCPLTGRLKPMLERIVDYFDEHIGYLDPCVRKPNQLYYAPAHPPGGAHLYQCRQITGLLLDPADFPEIAPVHAPRSEQPTPPEHAATSTKPGELFNARANWADLLEPLGWTRFYRNHWTRPGKRLGVSATVLDAGLYIHTSAPEAMPFACGKTYTLFGAYTAINHNGDFTAAAKELRLLTM